MTFLSRVAALLTGLGLGVVGACSGGTTNVGSVGPQTGQACSMAAQCYAGVDAATLHGQPTCLTQLQNGYCSHTCLSDSDCCAVAGECPLGFREVCASFESSGQMYCFLSCASSDIASASDGAATDPSAYCQHFASASFTCRSTGGGSANRKFCGP
jgi:hypothetical protein